MHRASVYYTIYSMNNNATISMATQATLHCLLGCSIGEIIGMICGAMFGWHNLTTTVVSIALAFVTGYILSAYSLQHGGMPLKTALRLVLLADTLSITTMEIVDNAVMLLVPGAMNAGLANPIFWTTMPLSLLAAFIVATPVNYMLIKHGQGHALMHEHHHHM